MTSPPDYEKTRREDFQRELDARAKVWLPEWQPRNRGTDLAGAVAVGDRHGPRQRADGAAVQRAGEEVLLGRRAVRRHRKIQVELQQQALLAALLGVGRLHVHHIPYHLPLTACPRMSSRPPA